MGRPRQYNPADFVDDLCAHLAKGLPMAEWSRVDGNPSLDVVETWQKKDDDVARRIAHAREVGGDAIAADALRIADDTSGDTLRDRLRVETRLKLLAKWHPKRYGDRQQVEHSGKVELPAMDDREAATRLAALLREAQRQQGG